MKRKTTCCNGCGAIDVGPAHALSCMSGLYEIETEEPPKRPCAKPGCTSPWTVDRYSLGLPAGRWCDKHWETSGYRKEGREGFDPADAGERYEDDY